MLIFICLYFYVYVNECSFLLFLELFLSPKMCELVCLCWCFWMRFSTHTLFCSCECLHYQRELERKRELLVFEHYECVRAVLVFGYPLYPIPRWDSTLFRPKDSFASSLSPLIFFQTHNKDNGETAEQFFCFFHFLFLPFLLFLSSRSLFVFEVWIVDSFSLSIVITLCFHFWTTLHFGMLELWVL